MKGRKSSDAPVVLFLPRYGYLSGGAFQAVATELESRGMRPVLSRMDQPDAPYSSWPGETIESWPKHSGVARVRDILEDPARIGRQLGELKPALLLLSSDQGGFRVRLAAREAQRRSIPVVILLNVVIADPTLRPLHAELRAMTRFLPSRVAAVTYEGNVPGSYARRALVCVAGPAAAVPLLRGSVPPSRIIQTGDPGIDEDSRKICKPPSTISEIVLWTEVIHETLGAAYAKDIFFQVRDAARQLGLPLRIRLHPREPDEYIAFYEAESGATGRVDRGPISDAIWADAVHVAHHSTSLHRVAVLSRPSISINFNHLPGGILLPESCEVSRPADLLPMLRSAIADPAGWVSRLAEWRSEHAPLLDGRSAERVTDLIERLIGGSPEASD